MTNPYLIGCSVISQAEFDKIKPDKTYTNRIFIIRETQEGKLLHNGEFETIVKAVKDKNK